MAKRIVRPMSCTELLDELFDLYKKHFLLMVGAMAVLDGPWLLAMYTAKNGTWQSISSWLTLPLYSVQGAAIAWIVSACYLKRPPSALQAYRAVLPMLLPILITYLMKVVLCIAASALLIVPGILLFVYYTLTTQVVVLEGQTYVAALRRSFQLVRGHWLRVFTVATVTFLISMAISLSVTIPANYILMSKLSLYAEPKGTALILIHTAVGILTTPICPIASVLLYYDLRVRKEGLDLQLLAASISKGDGGK